jgi:hypothetical protein
MPRKSATSHPVFSPSGVMSAYAAASRQAVRSVDVRAQKSASAKS